MASLEVIEETEALLQGIDTGKPNYDDPNIANHKTKFDEWLQKKNTKIAPHHSF